MSQYEVCVFSTSYYRNSCDVWKEPGSSGYTHYQKPDTSSICKNRTVPRTIEISLWRDGYEYGDGYKEMLKFMCEEDLEYVKSLDEKTSIDLNRCITKSLRFIASALYLDDFYFFGKKSTDYDIKVMEPKLLIQIIDLMIDFRTQYLYHLNKTKYINILDILLRILKDKIGDKIENHLERWLYSQARSNKEKYIMMEEFISSSPEYYLDMDRLSHNYLDEFSPTIIDYAANNNIIIRTLVDFSSNDTLKKKSNDDLGMRHIFSTMFSVRIPRRWSNKL